MKQAVFMTLLTVWQISNISTKTVKINMKPNVP